ncbi:MAG: DUF1995 family protein [Elainellaceae cyanobacterium]
MEQLPKSLEEAIAEAMVATQAALEDGYTRLQVELVFPELRMMPIAQQFLSAFEDRGSRLRVFFPDAGAAALARRDWGDKDYAIRGMGELKAKMQPDEELFIFIEPSSVEVGQLEELCTEAGDRPVVLLNPRLEDIATIGIGYAGRQLRERFLSQFDSCYYLQPTDGAAISRSYPASWRVWLEREEGEYELIAEEPRKPVGEALNQLLLQAIGGGESEAAQPSTMKRPGLLSGLQQFLRALSQ